MATTRKRASVKAATAAQAAVSADKLAEFIGFDGDEARLTKALDLATAAAKAQLRVEALPDELPHNIAQGVKLLATKLLLTDQLADVPAEHEIPLVVRYYFKLAADARS